MLPVRRDPNVPPESEGEHDVISELRPDGDDVQTSDDAADTNEAVDLTKVVTERIRREALRQLATADLDDPDSRVEPLPTLCRPLPLDIETGEEA